jgi:hypothetical protein
VYFYLDRVYDWQPIVPLAAGVTIGAHWADEEAKANEVVYNAKEELYANTRRYQQCVAEAVVRQQA